MSDDGDDRRYDPRGPIELKVEYTRLNAFFADYTRNISKDGTFIKTSKPLDIGTEFVFKLYVPELDDPLELYGQVRWILTEEEAASSQEPLDPGMGIKFLYRDNAERRRLHQLVENLMVGSLGNTVYESLMKKSARDNKGGD